MFKFKPDFDQVLNRYEAWWDCEIIDRPLTSVMFQKEISKQVAVPTKKKYATIREKWFDFDFIIELTLAKMENTVFYADALPVFSPNLGPEIFSAFYGCEMEYGEDTGWSKPILKDLTKDSIDRLQIDYDGYYYKKIIEMTNDFINVARDKFIVGYTDLHSGGDAIAAFRDPQQLCIDLIEHPEIIKKLCERVTNDFIKVYDIYFKLLSNAKMPSTTWLPGVCKGKYHVPSNDFSCMISEEMFSKIFLPGIINECRHMDRCIYHLDGPRALRYLDLLLEIDEIHAIQWVPGAAQDDWKKWINVYQKIQSKKKAFCVNVPIKEIDEFIDLFSPQGVWLNVSEVKDEDIAQTLLEKIERWK